jgi:site-specific DNA-methyltransferase (adenine-specific)
VIRPYYESDDATLYHGDCREFVAVDVALTLADPPYEQTSLAWDRWPDGWVGTVPGNSLWVFGSLRQFMDRVSEFHGWKFSQDVVWEKQNGSGFQADRFRRIHEQAAQFYRGPWGVVFKAPVRVDWGGPRKTIRKRGQTPHTGAIGNVGYEDDGQRLMTSVIYARNCHGDAEHETPKPFGIIAPLIEYSCPVDGLVYVPFAGSGSEMEAARQLGRRVVGIEIDESKCERAAKRLSERRGKQQPLEWALTVPVVAPVVEKGHQ